MSGISVITLDPKVMDSGLLLTQRKVVCSAGGMTAPSVCAAYPVLVCGYM